MHMLLLNKCPALYANFCLSEIKKLLKNSKTIKSNNFLKQLFSASARLILESVILFQFFGNQGGEMLYARTVELTQRT